MKSIRSFLLWRLLGGAALVLAGAGLAVYLFAARSLQSQFDENLADRVLGFASILFQVEDRVAFEFSEQLMPEYALPDKPAYFELRFRDGRLIERSDSLGEGSLTVVGEPSFEEPHTWSAPLPDGARGRFVAQWIEVHHVYPEEGPERPQAAEVQVVIARHTDELAAAQGAVLWACSAAAAALIGLIAVICWTAVARGLEPTQRMAAALGAIRLDALPQRLEAGELPTELEPVARTTDALMQRVDSALERERRVSADIAHELRTPISELLTVSEVALLDGRDGPATRRALETVRDVACRMGHSVSTLLELSRLEMGSGTRRHERLDLGTMTDELLRSLASIQRERGVRVESQLGPGLQVEGDREATRIVLSNLLSNALHYAPPEGKVSCRLERPQQGWCLLVENEAGDLAPEDLPALNEPFWRKDRARADPDRSGLGLALSCALAEKAAMRLEFELVGNLFRARLTGPPAGAQPGTNGRDERP